MTDKEKAENFVKENCCEFCINKDDCEMGYIDCNTKDGVLYGLAEGRKEKHISIIKGIARQNQKNAELKAQNEYEHNQFLDTRSKLEEQIEFNIQLGVEINELKVQNKDLCESLDIMNNREHELLEQIEELKSQVKKVKPYCKKLCKNYTKSPITVNDCIKGTCKNCDKWELAK